MDLYDVIIIGAGPAGVSASLYTKRANLNTLIVYGGKSNLDGAHKIDNYYGFPDGISGKDLYENGIEQAKSLGVEVKEAEVLGVQESEKGYTVKTEDGSFKGRTIILAVGNQKVKPNIKGIVEFDGKGVSYCAICDAFFFKNKNVVVIGDGKFAVSEAEELSHVVRNVTILTNGNPAPESTFKTIKTKIQEVKGTQSAEQIIFEDGDELNVEGIFVALGEAGARDFANKLGIVQDGENIRVNEKMETNVKGVYACGNITGGLLQVCKAVYEGAIAGLSAIEYVRKS